eukprot:9570837-Prorocentrum_lima.AAC.1
MAVGQMLGLAVAALLVIVIVGAQTPFVMLWGKCLDSLGCGCADACSHGCGANQWAGCGAACH